MKIKIARIHRFRDQVALYIHDGKTVYLTAAQANTLGEFLQEFARDIHIRDFIDSVLTSKEVNEKGEVN